MEWQGRNLTLLAKSNGEVVTYGYNADGIRTNKQYYNDSGYVTAAAEYVYDGTKLIAESRSGDWLYYFYDANGAVTGFSYNGTLYYFRKNLQGDVTGIYNANGTLVVEYKYTPYGALLSTTGSMATTIGAINPFRYRGYYYDTETGFYYLQSRYYDPVVGRFINADGYVSTGQGVLGYNMFAYCGNNPVMRKDPNGQGWLSVVLAVVVVVVVAVVVAKVVVDEVIDSTCTNDTERELAKESYCDTYQVYKATQKTQEYIDEVYGRQNDIDDTQVNAYRHAMWNAIMTDKIGEEKAEQFANAHEELSDNPEDKKAMDLHNNALGRRIAIECAWQGYDVFSQKIQEAINNGEAKVIKWDTNVN